MGQRPLFICSKSILRTRQKNRRRFMAVQLDVIRVTAQRVAASHNLELVDLEFQGGAKFRTLRVFIEKNAAERQSWLSWFRQEAKRAAEARRCKICRRMYRLKCSPA